jgi:cation transport ATPase
VLKQLGLPRLLLTGDNERADVSRANWVKVAAVQERQEAGAVVMMVGDGVQPASAARR